ncbi:beta-3 adrenergic receptor-like [Diadema antillarum]|uniref:beta-3 adrenergic receptor-like n=1 Tax=Diadema antillarum TaxID=105358 RepID=UPI003A88715A
MSVITAAAVTAMKLNASQTTPQLQKDEYEFYDYRQRIAVATFSILISVFGILGNSLVLFAVSLSKKLQNKVNVFVVNLSVADTMICCVLPFNVVALLSREGWPQSHSQHLLCSAASGFLWIGLGCGTITLALIAFNRYYVIKHNDFGTAYTSRRIAVMIIFSWLYPAILMNVVTQAGLGRLGYSQKYKSCLQDSTHQYSEYLSLFAGITVFLPSLLIIFFCYTMIFIHVRKHHRHLIRIFIIGGAAAEGGARNVSVCENSANYPSTPRSRDNVHFTFPPDNRPNPDAQSEGVDRPASLLECDTPASAAPSLTPSCPRTPVQAEDGLGPRTKSVSEELSHSVSRRQADITRNVFYVVLAFLICLAPYGVAILLPNSEPGIPWVMLLLQFNTCVNPVIYALKHPTFREVIPRILRCDFSNIPAKSQWLKKLLGRT